MREATTPAALDGATDLFGSRLAATVTPARAALATFLVGTALALAHIVAVTGAASLYTLDDPYIHLALAERIKIGLYGLNAGEISSPASSILWPFLLVPAASTGAGPYLPLILNVIFGAITALLLGRWSAGLDLPHDWQPAAKHVFRVAVAAFLVLALNLVGLAFTGLEHSLQLLLAVALALALIAHASGRPLPIWALALAALGPAVRYEMLALTAAVGLVLVVDRRWRAALLLAAASLAVPCIFALLLFASGNHPLPNSVMAKLSTVAGAGAAAPDAGWLSSLGRRLCAAAARFADLDLGGRLCLLAGLVIAAVLCWQSHGRRRAVLGAGVLVAILHFAAGQFGWWYRYELYAVGFTGLIALSALSPRWSYGVALAIVLAAQHYLPAATHTPRAAVNIYEQQHQMHRFVARHYAKPIAVNDIGWVSVGRSPEAYVLDLWGLASSEALRQTKKDAMWLDDVTRRHGVGLAMIYTEVFPEIPKSWSRVGQIHLASPRATAAYTAVGFYATALGDRAEIARALAAFRRELPAGVKITFD